MPEKEAQTAPGEDTKKTSKSVLSGVESDNPYIQILKQLQELVEKNNAELTGFLGDKSKQGFEFGKSNASSLLDKFQGSEKTTDLPGESPSPSPAQSSSSNPLGPVSDTAVSPEGLIPQGAGSPIDSFSKSASSDNAKEVAKTAVKTVEENPELLAGL